MRTEQREILAVGIFGTKSCVRRRIESLLNTRSPFSSGVSATRLAATVASLTLVAVVGSLAPRWIAFAQTEPQLKPEVTSIKPNTSSDRPQLTFLPNGRLSLKNIPLAAMLATAYNVPLQSPRLKGLPGDMATARFDIEATTEAFPPSLSETAQSARLRSLLQSILAERFKLVVRRETKPLPVYTITVAKNGPKLVPSKTTENTCSNPPQSDAGGLGCHKFTGGRGRGAHGEAVTLEDLATFVSNWSDRPVIDRTGLAELYKIDTKPWLPMQPGPPPSEGAKGEDGSQLADLPTLFGVFDELGLKLNPQQAPLDVYNIEHIEKPDAN
jgi:uncharacterized protein (TIGR03435 family)